jgi:hypothetical protein
LPVSKEAGIFVLSSRILSCFNGTLEELNIMFGMVKEPVQILTLEERVSSLEQRVLDLERG